MTKSYKTSYYVLYALIAVIVAVFGIFFLVGYDNFEGTLRVPTNTGLLVNLMYILSAVTFVMFLLGVLKELLTAKKVRLFGALAFIALLLVTFFIGSTESLNLADGTLVDSVSTLRFANMSLLSISFLLIVTVCVTAFSVVKGLAKK